ncbi:hypothetical protein D3C80_1070990 [compost metagenome]
MDIQPIALCLLTKVAKAGIIGVAKRLTFPIQYMHFHAAQLLLMSNGQQILRQDFLHAHIEMKGVGMQIKRQILRPQKNFLRR